MIKISIDEQTCPFCCPGQVSQYMDNLLRCDVCRSLGKQIGPSLWHWDNGTPESADNSISASSSGSASSSSVSSSYTPPANDSQGGFEGGIG